MADKNISELQTAAEVAPTDFLHLRQGGIDRKATVEQVRDKVLEDLANDTDPTKGAALVGYKGRSVAARLADFVNPGDFGGVGDGVADDAPAIIAALAAGKSVNLRNKRWRIGSTVVVPDGRVIDARGADIIADTGASPLFEYGVGGQGFTFLHSGGLISGTASAVLRAVGSTNTPTAVWHYARNIRLHDLYVSSATIDWFIDAVNAVRQVFIDSCFAFTKSGIHAIGKCVEWKVNKSILFSATGAVGTRGLVLKSPGGGAAYHEGWHFTDCTIDNYEKNEIDDIFVFTLNGGYLGTKTVFGQPTTTHCREISIGNGAVLSAAVEFTPSVANDYRASIAPAMFTNVSGNCVLGNPGASGISVDTKFVSSGDGATAVRFVSDNSNCHVTASADATFERIASFEGFYGPRCSVLVKSYIGATNPIYAEHPVRVISSPITNSVSAGLVQNFVQASGTFAVGATIATVMVSLQKGDSGSVVVSLSAAGMSPTVNAQRLLVDAPAGMVFPSGPGWSAQHIRPQFAQGLVYVELPFYCTAEISAQALSIINSAGNTVSTGSHSYFGYRIK